MLTAPTKDRKKAMGNDVIVATLNSSRSHRRESSLEESSVERKEK
jgi:hypothetical protein